MTHCPYCEADTGHLNNHVRMSAGDGHGPQGQYPEDWDRQAAKRAGSDPEQHDPDGDAPPVGEHAAVDVDQEAGDGDQEAGDVGADHAGAVDAGADHAESDVDLDRESEAGDDLAELLFGDTEADASEYECGSCGTSVPYLGGDDAEEGGKECPECGERLVWSMVEP